jgi:transcriptional regulator with XRE-family HTH domain
MIGKKIKAIRKTRGLSQQQLADLMDVTRSTISNWECGRRSPHLNELESLANKLNVTLEYFKASGDDVKELLAKASQVFNDDHVTSQEKADIYKELMKIYLKNEK